jgi:hypothetical protein
MRPASSALREPSSIYVAREAGGKALGKRFSITSEGACEF